MSSKSAVTSNIENRSPWLVRVRAQPDLDKRFRFGSLPDAQRYCAALSAQGIKAKLTQLETSFQLRVRRKGVPLQHITFDTWEEAEQARLHIGANLSVSIVRDYGIATKYTLRDLMQRYLEEVVPGHKGGAVEANRLRRMMRKEAFVDKKLAALATEDLQDFITDRLTEVAPATVDRDLDVISQVLRYADDVWKIAPVESPFKGLRRPQYFNERDRRLSSEEEKLLLEAARADENPFLEPAIVLALETAMRRSELLSLTPDDINFEMRYAHLKDTKNGRSRKVPLTQRAMQVFRALLALQSPTEDDGRLLDLTANALKKGFFERVLPATGIVDLHFHDLRHESISRLAESGRFQLIELQAISGHRDMRMLQRYAHLCAGNLANKMDEMRGGGVKEYFHRGRKRTAVKVDKNVIAVSQSEPMEPSGETAYTSPNVIDFFAAKRRIA